MKPAPRKSREIYHQQNIKYQHTLYNDGTETFIRDDKVHRIDGPASTDRHGNKAWYIDGELIACNSQEEFEKTVQYREWQLRVFS